jgi:hypothetical protein
MPGKSMLLSIVPARHIGAGDDVAPVIVRLSCRLCYGKFFPWIKDTHIIGSEREGLHGYSGRPARGLQRNIGTVRWKFLLFLRNCMDK